MSELKGQLLTLEGTDGSGKTEQTKLLIQKLKDRGFSIATFDFPRYGEPSAYFIEHYLNGYFGTSESVNPRAAALFFALDRYATRQQIREALDEGKIVVINRYVASNMAHQGAKVKSKELRMKFYKWIATLEYKTLEIPRPSLNIILHVPAETAQKLVDRKSERSYIKDGQRDIHEDDINHLENAEAAYLELATEFPQFFELIECVKDQKLLSKDEVASLVWQRVATKLNVES